MKFILYIEGAAEDSQFTFHSLEKARASFSKWCRDSRNWVTLYVNSIDKNNVLDERA